MTHLTDSDAARYRPRLGLIAFTVRTTWPRPRPRPALQEAIAEARRKLLAAGAS